MTPRDVHEAMVRSTALVLVRGSGEHDGGLTARSVSLWARGESGSVFMLAALPLTAGEEPVAKATLRWLARELSEVWRRQIEDRLDVA